MLYDFGHYPGAVKSHQTDCWVQGEVHRLDNPELLTLLDEYEGSEYERAMVSVTPATLGSSRTLRVMVPFLSTVATQNAMLISAAGRDTIPIRFALPGYANSSGDLFASPNLAYISKIRVASIVSPVENVSILLKIIITKY